MGYDASQLDDGGVAGHPGGGPGGVANVVAIQHGGEGRGEVFLWEDLPVVIVSRQLDVVLLGKFNQILQTQATILLPLQQQALPQQQ